MKIRLVIIFLIIISPFSCKRAEGEQAQVKKSDIEDVLLDSITKLHQQLLSQEYTIQLLKDREEHIVKEEVLAYWSDATTIAKLRKMGIADLEIQKIVLSLTKEMENLRESNDFLSSTQLLTYWFDSLTVESLMEKGIKNPDKDIIRSLNKREDLIAKDAVLGGTMHFGRITLLGNSWAITEAEDGHVALYYLLKYKIKDDKSLQWTVLDKTNVYD